MKRSILFTFLLMMGSIFFYTSCKRNLVPPGPYGVPPTATRTSTLVATATATFTRTLTRTVTPSPTGPLPATSTSTITPTVTITPTAAPPTNTPTFTPCVSGALLSSYGFETDVQCWAGEFQGTGTTVSVSNTTVHSGSGAMQLVAPFASGSNQTATFRLTFGAPANLTGKTIKAWVYVPSPALGGGPGGAPMFLMSGSGWCWEDNGQWSGYSTADQWVQITFTPLWGGACSPNSAQVNAIGFNIVSGTAAAPATLYVDDVTITDTVAPPTPTSTPSAVQGWYFESGTDSWIAGGGSVVGTVTSSAPGYNSSNSLNEYCPFTAQNQYMAFQYNAPSPLNVPTGIRAQVWMDAGITDGYPGCQIIVADGTNTVYGSWNNLTQGAWTQIVMPLSEFGAVVPSNIQVITVQPNLGGSGTVFNGGFVMVDQVEIY